MKTLITSLSLAASLATGARVASAQASDNTLDDVPAMTRGLELTIAGTYLQGAGGIGGDMSSASLVNLGGGTELSIGYRVTAALGVGAYGVINGFAGNDAPSRLTTASLGGKLDWHFAPTSWTAPWLSIGAGIKTLWAEKDALERRLVGIELLNVHAGLDLRTTSWFAAGPVVSASVTTYTLKHDSTMIGYAEIPDKEVNLTLTVGLQGRFDLFGSMR
jgi:hypothetical protein